MQTLRKRVTLQSHQVLAQAAHKLVAGELVVFPTETVYGLGANALDSLAVKRIFAAKGRPSDNPLIVHIADTQMLPLLTPRVSPLARKLMDAFWPGPLTILFPVRKSVPRETTGGLRTIAIRMPQHPIARALIHCANVPIAAPSANLSGRPSPSDASHAWDDLRGKVPLILDSGPCDVGIESTVVALRGNSSITILRQGSITAQDIKRATGILPKMATSPHNGVARSPGQKYRHYSPRIPVYWVHAARQRHTQTLTQRLIQALAKDKKNCVAVIAPSSHLKHYTGQKTTCSLGSMRRPATQAQSLFASFRTSEARNATHIVVEGVAMRGIGAAVAERLARATSYHITSAEDITSHIASL